MRRWSADRGTVEPVAALAAVFALAVGLTLYAGALQTTGNPHGRDVAGTVLESITNEASTLAVLRPSQIDRAVAPAGFGVNITLRTPGDRFTVGGAPPATADRATRRVAVRVAPAEVEPGRLRVAVW